VFLFIDLDFGDPVGGLLELKGEEGVRGRLSERVGEGLGGMASPQLGVDGVWGGEDKAEVVPAGALVLALGLVGREGTFSVIASMKLSARFKKQSSHIYTRVDKKSWFAASNAYSSKETWGCSKRMLGGMIPSFSVKFGCCPGDEDDSEEEMTPVPRLFRRWRSPLSMDPFARFFFFT